MPGANNHKRQVRMTRFGHSTGVATGSGFLVPLGDSTMCKLRDIQPSPEEQFAEMEEPSEIRQVDYKPQLTEHELELVLDKLPPIEADMVWLWFHGKGQTDIATIFGMTQAAVSYRIMRATKRLQYFIQVQSLFTPEDIERDLRGEIRDLDVEILKVSWMCTSQTVTAKTLGMSQGRVRHRLFKCVRFTLPKIAAEDPKLEVYLRGFTSMLGHRSWNITREVPVWAAQQNKRAAALR